MAKNHPDLLDFESELQHIDVALRFDIDHIRKIVKEIQSGVKTVESELIEISRIPTHENDRQEKIDIWYNFCKYFCNVIFMCVGIYCLVFRITDQIKIPTLMRNTLQRILQTIEHSLNNECSIVCKILYEFRILNRELECYLSSSCNGIEPAPFSMLNLDLLVKICV